MWTRCSRRSTPATSSAGLQDYVIFATLAYTAARVGAVAKLKRGSLRDDDGDWSLRFSEKGGKQRLIPVRHDLKYYLSMYLNAAGLRDAAKPSPLFRASIRREKRLTSSGMTGHGVCRMFKRRLKDAGSATDLLSQGVPLEDVQYLLGHADPRSTRLYDHRSKKVTRNVVERISSVTPDTVVIVRVASK